MGFIATDLEGRKRELVETFVENGLQNPSQRPYPPQKAGKWLAFLANKMKEENLAAFELINLKPGWMPRRVFLFNIIFSVVNGVVGGLCIFLFAVIIAQTKPGNQGESAINPWIGLGLLIGVGIITSFFVSLTKHEIKTDEVRTWSWAHFRQNWRKGIGFFFLGIVYLFDVFSNVKIIRSFVFAMVMFIFGFALAGNKKSALLQINKPYQRFNASLRNGVFPIITHACLRLAIFLEGALPLHLVHFLDEMAARHLLESDGGAWRFRHKILQD